MSLNKIFNFLKILNILKYLNFFHYLNIFLKDQKIKMYIKKKVSLLEKKVMYLKSRKNNGLKKIYKQKELEKF